MMYVFCVLLIFKLAQIASVSFIIRGKGSGFHSKEMNFKNVFIKRPPSANVQIIGRGSVVKVDRKTS